jgi:hypothetical protein
MIMTTTKSLMLAVLATLSFGAGAVRAQTLSPSGAQAAWYAAQNRAAANNTPANNTRGAVSGTVQSGTSDPSQARPVYHFEGNMAGGGF